MPEGAEKKDQAAEGAGEESGSAAKEVCEVHFSVFFQQEKLNFSIFLGQLGLQKQKKVVKEPKEGDEEGKGEASAAPAEGAPGAQQGLFPSWNAVIGVRGTPPHPPFPYLTRPSFCPHMAL